MLLTIPCHLGPSMENSCPYQCHAGGGPSSISYSHGWPTVPLPNVIRHHLNKKQSLKHVIYHFTHEKIITAILSECQYNALLRRASIFKRLSWTPKRHRANHKSRISEKGYPEVTVNMMGHGHAQSAAPRYDNKNDPDRKGYIIILMAVTVSSLLQIIQGSKARHLKLTLPWLS